MYTQCIILCSPCSMSLQLDSLMWRPTISTNAYLIRIWLIWIHCSFVIFILFAHCSLTISSSIPTFSAAMEWTWFWTNERMAKVTVARCSEFSPNVLSHCSISLASQISIRIHFFRCCFHLEAWSFLTFHHHQPSL